MSFFRCLLSNIGARQSADDLGEIELEAEHIDMPGILDYGELPTAEEWKAWEERQTTPSGSKVIQ
jgi:hypothetical protein